MPDSFAILTSVLLVVLLAVLLRSFLGGARGPSSDAEELPEPLARELASLIRPLDLSSPRVKDVAILVVRLPDYGELSRGASLEDLFRLMNQYYRTVTEVADKQFGEIMSPTGGEVMIVFGRIMPVEAPLRVAAQTALEIVSGFRPVEESCGAAASKCRGAAAALVFGEAMSGPIGTERRRTYVTVGPIVDRVLEIARCVEPGEVRVPGEISGLLEREFRLSTDGRPAGTVRIVEPTAPTAQ